MVSPPRLRYSSALLILSTALVTVLGIGVTPAQAAQSCATGSQVTICAPSATLSGYAQVTITATSGLDITITWVPSNNKCVPGFSGSCMLTEQFGPNPGTSTDYSFTWPTAKYLDGGGQLNAAVAGGGSVSLSSLTLSNGNATTIAQTPGDWQNYLPPTSWSGSSDPTFIGVGDGADNQPTGNAIANSIAQANPPLFLYMGDVYEAGTSTEMLNHYGWNPTDGPCPAGVDCSKLATWGQFASVTQPTIGNHELKRSPATDGSAWVDYWHQRPLFTSFVFANALFIDLACGPGVTSCTMQQGGAQYNYVQALLSQPHPPCVISYWHIPFLNGANMNSDPGIKDMWTLLTNNGGTLVFNGHYHNEQIFKPMNAQGEPPSQGQPTMTEVVVGGGGHSVDGSANSLQPKQQWTLAQNPGALYVTLNGAKNGGTPTSVSFQFEDANHNVQTDKNGNPGSGSVSCGSGSTPTTSITGFSPTSGPVGTSVTINGTLFTGTTDVKFNGLSVGAGNFTVDNDGQITATVPAGATDGPITVVAPGGSPISAASFQVTSGSGPAPTITSFSPTSAPVGTLITVNGTNFTTSAVVKFNGVTGTSFVYKSPTKVKAKVPAGATTGPISVTTTDGTGTSATNFVVPSSGLPTITSFSPSSGPVGTSVTISGTLFTGTTDVKFNGLSVGAGNFTVDNDGQITATVPAGATDGPITVVAPGGSPISAASFQVTSGSGPAPTITSFSPTSGPVGTLITVNGTNFTTSAVVKFNGVTGTSFVYKSPTKVKAKVPAGATTGPISVTTTDGTGTSATNFVVPSSGLPTITSFSPSSGPVGTSVTINGSNLAGATVVKFAGVKATFIVNSDTQITATVPAGAATGLISVITPTGTAKSPSKFKVT